MLPLWPADAIGFEPLGPTRLSDPHGDIGACTMDFVYIALGLALFGAFGLYAVVLRRV
jgi:hypothetical protein